MKSAEISQLTSVRCGVRLSVNLTVYNRQCKWFLRNNECRRVQKNKTLRKDSVEGKSIQTYDYLINSIPFHYLTLFSRIFDA